MGLGGRHGAGWQAWGWVAGVQVGGRRGGQVEAARCTEDN